MNRLFVVVVTLLLASRPLVARDAFVIQVAGPLVFLDQDPCTAFEWTTELLALNTTSTVASIDILGTSNGSLPPSAHAAFLAPNSATSLPLNDLGWIPVENTSPVWVLHLDVPQGIIIQSRIEPTGLSFAAPCPAYERLLARGDLPLPVMTDLIPPLQAQYFLGADLGDLVNTAYATIYNAAATDGHATVDVFWECDGALLSTVQITIPPNTTLQAAVVGDYGACAATDTIPRGRYLVITQDTTGFSVVSVSDNDAFKKMSMSVWSPQH
jgi:hypothetical protein